MFKPLPKHDNFDPYTDISPLPCGYIAYGRYIIPILLASENERKLRECYMKKFHHHEENINYNNYFLRFIDIISGISFECSYKSCYGNIIIGDALFHCLTYEELFPIIYHEIAHMMAPGYVTETDADKFAASHMGPQNLLKALKSFESFRFSFKKNLAKHILEITDIDDKIDQLMAITLSEDSAFHLYRKEYIERCRYVIGLPITRLYLNENTIKECKNKYERMDKYNG